MELQATASMLNIPRFEHCIQFVPREVGRGCLEGVNKEVCDIMIQSPVHSKHLMSNLRNIESRIGFAGCENEAVEDERFDNNTKNEN